MHWNNRLFLGTFILRDRSKLVLEFSTPTMGLQPPTLGSETQCSDHWTEESVPRHICHKLYLSWHTAGKIKVPTVLWLGVVWDMETNKQCSLQYIFRIIPFGFDFKSTRSRLKRMSVLFFLNLLKRRKGDTLKYLYAT